MWDMLFVLAFRMDETRGPEALADFSQLCRDLEHALPCDACKQSYGKFLARVPPSFEKRSDVSKWLWTVKDMVNQKLNRPYVPYATVRDKYARFRTLVGDSTPLELVLLCMQHNDASVAPRIACFAQRIGRLGRGVFSHRACDALEEFCVSADALVRLEETARQMSSPVRDE